MSDPSAEPTLNCDELQSNPSPLIGWGNGWAKAMFFLAAVYLACIAVVLPHQGLTSEGLFEEMRQIHWFWPNTFLGIWGFIVLEGAVGLFRASDSIRGRLCRFFSIALIPPLRMSYSVARPNSHVWVPRQGWLCVSEGSSKRMELSMAVPMLLITMLIIPVLLVEYAFKDLPERPIVALSLHMMTALIWFAFAMEFILLLGVADKKLHYCKRHWVNLVIIILPMIAFFRVLRILRVGRLARLGKMLRAYRLRGFQMRALRVVMLFNLVERFLRERQPERYLKHLEARIVDKEQELEHLHCRAEEVRMLIAEKQAKKLGETELEQNEETSEAQASS